MLYAGPSYLVGVDLGCSDGAALAQVSDEVCADAIGPVARARTTPRLLGQRLARSVQAACSD